MSIEKAPWKIIEKQQWTNVLNKKRTHFLEAWVNMGLINQGLEGDICKNCERTNDNSVYSKCAVAKKIDKLRNEYDMQIVVIQCGAIDELTGTLLYVPREK
jgi:hypothetical protein